MRLRLAFLAESPLCESCLARDQVVPATIAHHVVERRERFGVAAAAFWSVYRERIGMQAWAAAVEERAARHTLACLLARVAGRSTLEYLDEAERRKQRDVVVALLPRRLAEIPLLIQEFVQAL